MLDFSSINWLAVVVGVVVGNARGFLSYGPLFGDRWLRMIGKTKDKIESSPTMFIVTIASSLVTMIVLALVVDAFGAASFVEGLIIGAVANLGLSAASTYVYTNFEGPPTSVWPCLRFTRCFYLR
ncbi:MAG: DUF1761 domain-containing protein [Anaerolineales bacterium]